MSEAAARRIVSKLGAGRVEMHLREGLPTEYIEYAYPASWPAYDVGYLGRPGRRHVAFIMTHVFENKTRQGIGPYSLQAKLLRTHRDLRCRNAWSSARRRTQIECRLGMSTRRHTVFVIYGEDVFYGKPPVPNRIAAVIVRESFQRPEAPSFPSSDGR